MLANSPTTNYAPSLRIKAAAELELRRRLRERSPFGAWLHDTTPTFQWDVPHLTVVREQLEAIERGEIDRLMIFMPPRHGKSELATVRYPVWRLQRDPALSVIVGAYNVSLAESFSRKSRRIAESTMQLDDERKASNEWQTVQGGVFRAAGVGTGVTGKGAKLIIIDDPVKSREEANSQAYRDRVWNWYRDDLYTRLEPNGAIVLIMTRWHEDDLAGRILGSEDAASWHVVNLPALAEEGDALGRAPGQALWPARFDEADLERIRTVLGTPSFTALYQQRPTPPEGGMFKRHWFDVVGAAPREATRVRYWDKAGSSGKGDYTVGLLMAKDKTGVFYVEDVVRGQWSALERETIIKQTAQVDAQRGRVTIWQEQEPGSGGLESAQATARNLAGYTVHTERVTGDKETRAMPYAAQCEALNVKLVAGEWNAAYLDELTGFPYGAHDDQVDASSGAFNKLAVPEGAAVMQSPVRGRNGGPMVRKSVRRVA
jgi:predicted phage terminase large subunit-like protein